MNSIYYLNYASVLFEMARQQKKLEKYTKDAQILFNTFHHNHDLQRFFINASIPATYRKQTFLHLFKNKIEKKIIYFV
jgi:F0F1-type ATP synthase delta subunit